MKAIVDKANADTAPLRNAVIGSQSVDILRDDPARLKESAMGNFVADAMRAKYPTASRRRSPTRAACGRTSCATPPTGGEQPGEITWGEVFAVLPFGNRTVIVTLTYEQLVAAFENGFKPPCGDSSGGTGRTPQFSGLKVAFHCTGTVPVIDNIWLTPAGSTARRRCSARATRVRIVTNDFMFTGGDGYTAFAGGTNVLQHGRPAARRDDRVHHGATRRSAPPVDGREDRSV